MTPRSLKDIIRDMRSAASLSWSKSVANHLRKYADELDALLAVEGRDEKNDAHKEQTQVDLAEAGSETLYRSACNICGREWKDGKQVAGPDTWLPIESAPKDGTPVLVFDEGAILIASYVERGDDDVKAGWYDNGIMEPPPQFWMPLPAPPSEPPS